MKIFDFKGTFKITKYVLTSFIDTIVELALRHMKHAQEDLDSVTTRKSSDHSPTRLPTLFVLEALLVLQLTHWSLVKCITVTFTDKN